MNKDSQTSVEPLRSILSYAKVSVITSLETEIYQLMQNVCHEEF